MNSGQHPDNDSAIQALVNHWRNYMPGPNGPYIHPDDDPFIRKGLRSHINECTVRAFLKHRKVTRIHTWLHPVPYMGDLQRADLVLLMINPTVTYEDYGTQATESFQTELTAEIRQERRRCLALDPDFWWTSWFRYYGKLFGPTIRELAQSRKQNRYDVLASIASRLAILELVPYSSARIETVEDISYKLPSSNLARAAAWEIADRAKQRKATVIVRWTNEEGKKETRWRLGPPSTFGTHLIPNLTRIGFSKEAQQAVLKCLKKPYNDRFDNSL